MTSSRIDYNDSFGEYDPEDPEGYDDSLDDDSLDDDLLDDELTEEETPEDMPDPNNRDRARTRGYRSPYQEPTRKPAAERDAAFNAMLWLIEGATGIVEELRHSDLGLSEDFWMHASAARREGLLAARALLDQMIEATEEKKAVEREKEERRSRRGGSNVDF